MLNILSKSCQHLVHQSFERTLKQMLTPRAFLFRSLFGYKCLVINVINQGLKNCLGLVKRRVIVVDS